MKRFFMLLVVFLFLLSLAGFSKDIYVRAGASGRGSKENPYGTLWKALSKAERGDVIHVAAGTYNAKGGSGAFIVKVPNLTVVGGYNSDFSQRNPFKYLTILERAKDYRGDALGLREGIVEGKGPHGGLIFDGFVLNSQTRNRYTRDKSKILPKDSWKGALFKASAPNIKIRNCIFLNPYGNGIYCAWQGKDNEVANNFILNTFYAAISTRSAQPDSVIKIKNNTVMFVWFQPGKGGGFGVFVGRQGQTIIENNIFAFINTEGGEAGVAVINGFGNEDTILKNNIFFQCQGGFYKYMDSDGKNLVVWKASELADMEEDAEEYMLSECEGNSASDPKLKPDKWYFGKFAAFVESKPGKLNMDAMNQWRRALGLPLQAARGSARKNWGMPYPLNKVVPNLVSKTGKGVNANGPFPEYKSKAVDIGNLNYEEVTFDAFKGSGAKALNGKPVSFKAGMNYSSAYVYLKNTPRSEYKVVKLLKPGESEYTRNYVFGYLLKGSKAYKKWEKYYKKKRKYNKKGGIRIKGRAYYLGKAGYSYPVGVIIDKVSKK